MARVTGKRNKRRFNDFPLTGYRYMYRQGTVDLSEIYNGHFIMSEYGQ